MPAVSARWRRRRVASFAAIPYRASSITRRVGTADAQKVLTAMRDLPGLLDARPTGRVPKDYLDARRVNVDLVPGGWWQRLVFPKDRPEGTVDRNAYVFCVLELFHAGLRHRDIFATVSDRWSDPRARLLAGSRWDDAKGAALSTLQLPEDPDRCWPRMPLPHCFEGDVLAPLGGLKQQGRTRTCSATPTSRPCSTLAPTCATCRSPPVTPTHAPRCDMTGPATTWTATRTTSWPPTWPPAPDLAYVSCGSCRGRRPTLPKSG